MAYANLPARPLFRRSWGPSGHQEEHTPDLGSPSPMKAEAVH